MGHRISLDAVEKRKPLAPPRNQTCPACNIVFILTELSWFLWNQFILLIIWQCQDYPVQLLSTYFSLVITKIYSVQLSGVQYCILINISHTNYTADGIEGSVFKIGFQFQEYRFQHTDEKVNFIYCTIKSTQFTYRKLWRKANLYTG